MTSKPYQRPSAYRRRQPQGSSRVARLLLAITAVTGVLAIGPIVWGIVAGAATEARPTTAFATAPPGTYAVVTRTEGAVDVVGVARIDEPANVIEIARVPQLDGFRTTGAVSPNGRYTALVVVDGGTLSHPVASLAVVDLKHGTVERLVSGIEPSQRPLWNPAGDAILVTRSASGQAPARIDLLEVQLDRATRVLRSQEALGVYPVGWRDGQLLTVVIDARGSTLQADGQDIVHLAQGITRDWALDPTSRALAFVEVSTASGVRYLPRVVSLENNPTASAQALTGTAGEALGVAWRPGGGPAFGDVPREGGGDASAQALRADDGFDIPLAYSPDGSALLVVHWDGTAFETPGRPELQVIRGNSRATVPGFGSFLGWAQR